MTNPVFTLPDFSDLHMIVIGDVMIDRYINGRTDRISPEAPVPVLAVEDIEDRLGGAANVCANLMSLGANVTLITVLGNDENAEILENLLKKYPLITSDCTKDTKRPTTVKTRVMAQNQHLIRIDQESTEDIDHQIEESILTSFKTVINSTKVDGVIMQDYNKGMFTERLIGLVIDDCHKMSIPSFVDPKFNHFFSYRNCTLFKPNQKELTTALGATSLDFDTVHKALREKLNHQITFLTLGKNGIFFQSDTEKGMAKTSPRSIADVCGAGDTVISVVSLCYCKGMALHQIAEIANMAGGQVCEKPGVTIVDRNALESECKTIKG